LSICDAYPCDGLLRVVFEVRGEGTRWLSGRKAGETIRVLGPLGNGFDLALPGDLPALFLAGGIGTPPIHFAAKRYKGECDVVAGFRSKDAVILEDDLRGTAGTLTVCTDDGSYGACGLRRRRRSGC
jgi:dihydroorotate dehydrogenase electron transfer subunit